MTERGADRPVAVVTGANRGIGLEVCRQLAHRGYVVVLGSRDEAKGEAAARAIAGDGGPVLPCRLDVTDDDSIARARTRVGTQFGRLDALVNNAAVLYDTWQRAVSADLSQVREALETNTLGAWRMVQAFLPLLRRSPHPRVVNVSSESGSRTLASERRGDRVLVNAVCPGWVATDMGGTGGRPVAEGAASVVWAVVLPDDGPTGGFFRDGRKLAW